MAKLVYCLMAEWSMFVTTVLMGRLPWKFIMEIKVSIFVMEIKEKNYE